MENAVPYELREDRLDPGWILFTGLREEMRRQRFAAAEEASARAFAQLCLQVCGPPWSARAGRGWVAWDGSAGAVVPADARLEALDRMASAQLARRRPLLLGKLVTAAGITPVGRVLDLSARLLADAPRPTDADAEPLAQVRFGFQLALPRSDVVDFPGLAWDVPAAVGIRTSMVQADGGTKLRWVLDTDGRLLVPPQRVAAWAAEPGGSYRLTVVTAVGAGDVRHLGRAWANVTPVRVPGTIAVRAGAFSLPRVGPGGALRTTQPFPCQAGIAAEGVEEWEARTAAHLRHGGRIVTATDVQDWLALMTPGAVVRSIEPARIRREREYRDAIRVTLTPLDWIDAADLLRRGLALGRRAEWVSRNRTAIGVELVAGPPTLRVRELPTPLDALWPYRDWLTTAPADKAFRTDGAFWPVHTVESLRAEAVR